MINIKEHIINQNATIAEALIALNNLSDDAMTLFVIDDNGSMVGSLTDGDVRRRLIKNGSLNDSVISAMKSDFYFINNKEIDVAEIKKRRNSGVSLLPLLDEHRKIKNIYNLKKSNSILPVDAVIMAGGKGVRLRPLTDTTPKPLLPIGNKAIIDYNVDNLINNGVLNISVTVNYLKEQLEKHFEQPRNGVQIECIPEPQYLGTLGSIKFVENFHNDTVLVMNSDLFTNINFEEFYLFFKNSDADMLAAAVPYTISIPYGIFDTEGDMIKGIKEKPSYNYYSNAGIYLIKTKMLELIPENTFFNATDFMELLINKGYKVTRFPLTGYWIDIGKHEDYNKVKELVKHL